MRRISATAWLALFTTLVSAPALGYVGPGAGLTLLSALWGLVVAVVAAMGFLVLWPIRRWRRRRHAAMEAAAEGDQAVSGAAERREADAERS